MKRLALPLVLAVLSAAVNGAAAGGDPDAAGKPAGHPSVTLDRLDLSASPLPASEEKYLRDVLAREAHNADWGAGSGARIEYRFRLEELAVTETSGIVRVRCSATGFLPKGKRARGRLAVGGAPKDHAKLVHHALEVVIQSVITRLADIERQRRRR